MSSCDDAEVPPPIQFPWGFRSPYLKEEKWRRHYGCNFPEYYIPQEPFKKVLRCPDAGRRFCSPDYHDRGVGLYNYPSNFLPQFTEECDIIKPRGLILAAKAIRPQIAEKEFIKEYCSRTHPTYMPCHVFADSPYTSCKHFVWRPQEDKKHRACVTDYFVLTET